MKINFRQWFLRGTMALLVLCVSAFQLKKDRKINIVFIGDSITAGSNTVTEQPSTYVLIYLKSKLGTDSIKQANEGVSGKTTVDFLPKETGFKSVIRAANDFYDDKDAQLLFSIMLGTNDSAMEGPNGAPVSPVNYRLNLETIINELINKYPDCKVVINYPLWYSSNTYNGAKYLAEGLARLKTYAPEIKKLVKDYGAKQPGHVFNGDQSGFAYFEKNHLAIMKHEEGHEGTFYLHPNEQGAAALGKFWGIAIYNVLK
jgi:lysophospholipase L1-like esterase